MDQDQSNSDRDEQRELSVEDADFFRCLLEPVNEPARSGDLRAELDRARDRIEELERKEGKVEVLQEQVNTLEAEAAACIELRRRVQELERSSQTQADLLQNNALWQGKFQAERSARQQAELRAKEYKDQVSQWQQEYQVLKSHFDASAKETDTLRADLRQLEPLKAWAGHPCSVCRKPMTGSVSRELAAKLQKDIGHKGCLDKRGSGLGKMLVAGVGLYGLSQLRQR
jgi:DNA repair exonuclease SbcCD ATPase subunit